MVRASLLVGSYSRLAWSKRGATEHITSPNLYIADNGSFKITGRLTLVRSYPIKFFKILKNGTGSSGLKNGSYVLDFSF